MGINFKWILWVALLSYLGFWMSGGYLIQGLTGMIEIFILLVFPALIGYFLKEGKL